jgi:superfamily II DNA or RNA helicase
MDYSYQDTAANQSYKNLLNTQYLASILAACPNAGKTTISQKIINKYLADFPLAKIVVLTHGQNGLKIQYLEELKNAHIQINFTYGDFSSDAQVRVGLPQSINQLNWKEIDLLIVDEAHHYYDGFLINKIIYSLKPKHQFLMTGSPSEYVAWNQKKGVKKYGMYFIAAEDLEQYGVFSGVNMNVAESMEIESALKLAKKNNYNTDKLMIACSTIEKAVATATILEKLGRKVIVSTSENDKDGNLVKDFKNNKYDSLVVVCRGILGFNEPTITCLIDLRASSNLDASYQLFARVLRKHPNGIRKAYIRGSKKGNKEYNNQIIMLYKIKSLMTRNCFKNYNGKNLKIDLKV